MRKAAQSKSNKTLSNKSQESNEDMLGEDSEEAADAHNTSFDSVKSKRGRPSIPESWSGVFLMPDEEQPQYNICPINPLLEQDDIFPTLPRGTQSKQQWKMLFHPCKYQEKHPGMTINNCTLSNAKLQQYAKQLTKLRKDLRTYAYRFVQNFNMQDRILAIDEQGQFCEDIIARVNAFSAKMQRGYFHKYVLRPTEIDGDLSSDIPIGQRRKTKRKPPKPEEVVQICYEVLVQKQYQKDVAQRHNLYLKNVSSYISKAKKNPKFITELFSKQESKQAIIDLISQAITRYKDQGQIITRAKDILNSIPEQNHSSIKIKLVQQVLKHEFDMTYRKVLKLAPQQNSEKNLILRQQWTLEYLKLVKTRRRIINIDESDLTLLDFTRKLWATKNSTQGKAMKQVSPRISMIMALDNFGVIYSCLTQINTSSQVMVIYIKELVKILDREDRHWRKNTIILHDGAKYAQSDTTLDAMRELRVPFMISSPHSYNIAPIELLFGAIKTGNLNEQQLPTSKGGFSNIIKLVVKKIQTIPKYQRVLWWHHCYQHLLRFLVFQEL